MIRKIVTALILVPLAIVVIALAVANRQTVVVSFDPFDQAHPAFARPLPLYALMLVLVIGGVVVGGVAAWLRQGKWRRAARLAHGQARELRAEVDRLKRRMGAAELPARADAGGLHAAAHHPAAGGVTRKNLFNYQTSGGARQIVGVAVEPRGARPTAMSVLIKICGLKTPEALDVALEAGADMVGFVFFPPSPRHVGFEAARALGERVRGRAIKVALSVDANDEELAAIIEALKPDLLQLHGEETPDRVVVVRARFGLPVMKALPIAERADLSPIRLYDKVADRLIFDARAPRDATRPGGLGKSFDWRLLENVAPASRSCSRAGSMPAMSRRRCGSPRRPASTSPPASSARPARRTPRKSAPSSAAAREAAAKLAAPNRMMSSA